MWRRDEEEKEEEVEGRRLKGGGGGGGEHSLKFSTRTMNAEDKIALCKSESHGREVLGR